MTVDMVIDALGLPPESRVDQRIAKKLLVENGAPTAADKKAINDGIEELSWIAELKSSNCGVPVYKDKEREYIEVAVLALSFRNGTKGGGASESRIIELVHRAIPYPVFLIASQAERIMLSLAAKRWAQNEGGRVVLDGEPVVVKYEDRPWNGDFLTGLSLGKQERRDFRSLYQSWTAQLVGYRVALVCDEFGNSEGARDLDGDTEALNEYARLQASLSALRSLVQRETQINRRVEINLEIGSLTAAMEQIRSYFLIGKSVSRGKGE
jgi:hypothetical protein